MWYVHQNEVIGCIAILIAMIILRSGSTAVRTAFFIVMFGTGVLAALASFADNAAGFAVSSLFG
jgi:hypothetical protein